MATPFIFTFNIRRSIFQQFGLSLYKNIANLKLQSAPLLILPIVNNLNDRIENRGQYISKLLP